MRNLPKQMIEGKSARSYILIESQKTLLCTHAQDMNTFCYVTVERWKFKNKKAKTKQLYRCMTRTYTYRTSFRTEITKLINATNKAIFTL